MFTSFTISHIHESSIVVESNTEYIMLNGLLNTLPDLVISPGSIMSFVSSC